MQNIVTLEKLVNDLSAIGLNEGDEVCVHTSLKSIGWLENGPQTLLDALLSVIGASGVLIAPTHSLNYTGSVAALKMDPYNGDNHAFTGAFPNFLRKRSDAYRSGSATHSSVAIGRNAEYYTKNHDLKNPLGYDSPLYRLYRNGGKTLLLGVSQNTNTILHLAEEMATEYTSIQCYKEMGRFAHIVDNDGTVKVIEQETFPGCSSNFTLMDGFFKYYGISRAGYIGAGFSQLLDAKKAVDLTAQILREKPDFLLCIGAQDHACDERRAFIMR